MALLTNLSVATRLIIALKKAAACLLRVKCFLQAKAKNQDFKFDLSDLTVQDLQNAEIELVKHEQVKHLSNLIFLLRNTA